MGDELKGDLTCKVLHSLSYSSDITRMCVVIIIERLTL